MLPLYGTHIKNCIHKEIEIDFLGHIVVGSINQWNLMTITKKKFRKIPKFVPHSHSRIGQYQDAFFIYKLQNYKTDCPILLQSINLYNVRTF